MSKISLKGANIFDIISKISIYVLIFLLPIFFLPITSNYLDFNKQAILIFLVFLSFFFYSLKCLIQGKSILNLEKFNIFLIIFLVVCLIATIFSYWPYGSFWGWPLPVSESLITLICLVLFYFLIINVFEKKEVFRALVLFLISSFLAIIFGILQLFKVFILPFNFTKDAFFNTVGMVNSLGFLAVALLSLSFILLPNVKKGLKAFLITLIIASSLLILIINFSVLWIVLAIASFLVMVFMMALQKKYFFDSRWMTLPMVFLTISLFFIFFKFPIPLLPTPPLEVFLTQGTSFNIAKEVLKESPLLGSGPGTFIYVFSKYKNPELNKTALWDVKFEHPTSKIFDILIGNGILGLLAYLIMIVYFFVIGVKFLFSKTETNKEEDKILKYLPLSFFLCFVVLNIGFFFYTSNLTIDFLNFFLMAGFLSFISSKKEFALKTSSLATLAFNFIFVLIIIFSFGMIILEGQKYLAEVNYAKGVSAFNQNKIDDSISYLEKAVRLTPKVDLYQRELSQIYLQKAKQEIVLKGLDSQDSVEKISEFINKSINTINAAVNSNPKNSNNLAVRALVYQNLIGLSDGAADLSIKFYEDALSLEPNNPYLVTQKGIALLAKASLLSQDKTDEKEKILSEAKKQFDKAISLKPDYVDAYLQKAGISQSQGNIEEAINILKEAEKITPNNETLLLQLGLLYYYDKDYENARIKLEKLTSRVPNYSNALYFLGLTYDELGNKEKSIEKFEAIEKLNPDNQEVKQILENLKEGKKALEGLLKEQPSNSSTAEEKKTDKETEKPNEK